MKRDYYETLGVEKSADQETLKKAFRKLAMQHHPDKNPGDHTAEQKFKELNEAYDVLKDEQKRAAYDRFGHAAFENGGMGGRGAGAGFAGGGFDFTDIFDEMFGEFMGGGRRGQQSRGRGADLRYNMEIALEEARRGGKRVHGVFGFEGHDLTPRAARRAPPPGPPVRHSATGCRANNAGRR